MKPKQGQDENPDHVLALKCQLGDTEAWTKLVDRWHPRLWRFTVRMVSDEGSADDVMQTVWMRVVRSLIRLRDPDRLEAWLYGVTRAAIADTHRSLYRRAPRTELVDVDEANTALDDLERRDWVESALQLLSGPDREVVVLHYLEERTVAEVAEVCGVAIGTVKSRLHRSRRLLAQHLREKGQMP